VGNASGRNRCGTSGRFRGVSSRSGCCVEPGHEFAVSGAGRSEIFVAFVELLLQVEVVLFEVVDALVEDVDVGRGAEPGLALGLFAEGFGQPFLEVLDAGVEPGGAFVGGEQVGLQRGTGDRRPGAAAGADG
jgi:hypothetical protein